MKNLLIKSESIIKDLDITYSDCINIKDYINESYESLYQSLGLDEEKYDFIYGFGNKQAIDFTKFISKKSNSNFILIPTILEYDNMFTNKIIDIKDNCNKIDQIKDPLQIIVDDNLLKKLNFKKQASGWATILCTLTACHAWRNYPHYFKTEYDQDIDFEINSCISKVSCPNNDKNRRELASTMKVFVDIEKNFNTSIHKESAEHYFVYNLMNFIELDCLFGEALALGILIISNIINPGLAKRAHHLMKKAGLECYLPSKRILLKTLSTLKDFVEDNNFNYSILNTRKFYQSDINEIIDKTYLMALELNHSENNLFTS